MQVLQQDDNRAIQQRKLTDDVDDKVQGVLCMCVCVHVCVCVNAHVCVYECVCFACTCFTRTKEGCVCFPLRL